MKKFLIRVTETINHDYVVEAENEDDALEVYYSYDDEQLENLDKDGTRDWEKPWEVEEIK